LPGTTGRPVEQRGTGGGEPEVAGMIFGVVSQPGKPILARVRRRRRMTVLAIAVPVLLVVVGGLGYATRLVHYGRFGAAPAACDAIRPMIGKLGATYELRTTRLNRSCDLWLPPGAPGYADAAKITVGFYPAEPEGWTSAQQVAGGMLRDFDKDRVAPVAGIGDEAYARDRDLLVRVSNLLLIILVFPNPVSRPEQVRAFAGAVVDGL
jgi:hypothetical protein